MEVNLCTTQNCCLESWTSGTIGDSEFLEQNICVCLWGSQEMLHFDSNSKSSMSTEDGKEMWALGGQAVPTATLLWEVWHECSCLCQTRIPLCLPFLKSREVNGAFPGCTSHKENPWCLPQCRRQKRLKSDTWVRKIPWRRTQPPTEVFLPRKSHG